jgi:hypothetical protein
MLSFSNKSIIVPHARGGAVSMLDVTLEGKMYSVFKLKGFSMFLYGKHLTDNDNLNIEKKRQTQTHKY